MRLFRYVAPVLGIAVLYAFPAAAPLSNESQARAWLATARR